MEKTTDRQERIPHFKQSLLRQGKILVVGAGATGNEVLKNLALVGANYVFICDMDHISTSNLSRTVLFSADDVGKRKANVAAQRFVAMNIDHGCADSFDGDVCYSLGEGFISQFDVVIGCTDNVQTRLFLNHVCMMLEIPYVDSGINGFDFALFTSSGRADCSCYACTMSENDEKRFMERVRNSCDVTRRHAAEMGHVPTIVLSAAGVGAYAASDAVKIIHHKKDNDSEMLAPNYGHMLLHLAADNRTMNVSIPIRKGCSHHYKYADIGEIIETPISCDWKLRDVLEWVNSRYGSGYCLSMLKDCVCIDRAFVTNAYCKHCGAPIEVYRPQHELEDADLLCTSCLEGKLCAEFPSNAEKKVYFDACSEERIMKMSLHELGIPPGHILQFDPMEEEKASLFLAMTGDFKRLAPNMPQ
ncbi:MAG: ThiF family adenylyltransferase [Clostridia bacterium]|nr:ThiF family adenylyltransferase [Clostridia bacterium]